MKIGDKVKIISFDNFHNEGYVGKVGEITDITKSGRFEVGFGEKDDEGWYRDWDLFTKKCVSEDKDKES